MTSSAHERVTPLCLAVIVAVLRCAWGCPGRNSLIRDGARTLERQSTLQKPQQLRVYSVPAPLAAREYGVPGLYFCYSRCEAHKFFCGFVCL